MHLFNLVQKSTIKKSTFGLGILRLVGASLLITMLIGSTPHGLALSPDSIAYLKAAEGLLTGHGLSFASVQWPPLYPMILAVFGSLFAGDLEHGARCLHAILLAVNFILIFELLIQNKNINLFLAFIFAFLLSISEPMILTSYYVWSEPLFIFLTLVDFYLLSFYLNKKSNNLILLEIGLVIVSIFVVMTRYIGIAVALINMISVFLIIDRKNIINRLLRASIQLIIPALIVAFWLAGHRAIDDNSAIERVFQFPDIDLSKVSNGLRTLGTWLYPLASKIDGAIAVWALELLGVAVLLLICWAVYDFLNKLSNDRYLITRLKNHNDRIRGCKAIFIFLYIVILALILFCYDKKIYFDNRFLSPIFIPLYLLIFSIAVELKSVTVRLFAIAAIILLLSSSYFFLRSWLLINYFDGVELNSRTHINKVIYREIKTLPRTCLVYADEPWNITRYFDEKVRWLPRTTMFGTGYVNHNYRTDVDSLTQVAQIVIVEKLSDPIIQILDSKLEYQRIYQSSEGVIWSNSLADRKSCELKK